MFPNSFEENEKGGHSRVLEYTINFGQSHVKTMKELVKHRPIDCTNFLDS